MGSGHDGSVWQYFSVARKMGFSSDNLTVLHISVQNRLTFSQPRSKFRYKNRPFVYLLTNHGYRLPPINISFERTVRCPALLPTTGTDTYKASNALLRFHHQRSLRYSYPSILEASLPTSCCSVYAAASNRGAILPFQLSTTQRLPSAGNLPP